jgi:hypothetical protein
MGSTIASSDGEGLRLVILGGARSPSSFVISAGARPGLSSISYKIERRRIAVLGVGGRSMPASLAILGDAAGRVVR